MKTVRVKVPATIGNLGPGFDVLGMALKLYTVVEISIDKLTKKNNTQLAIEDKDGSVPKDKKNIIWLAAKEVFENHGKYPGKCIIKSSNKIPIARGLGSSAAARVGGIMAANELCGGKLSKQQILNIASKLEGHPDNAAPAILGGVCISSVYGDEARAVQLSRRLLDLKVALCVPDFEVSTEKARRVFPARIARRDACMSLRNFSLSCIAYRQGDYKLLGESVKDYLHQPYRKKLVPGMERVFKSAVTAGAYGAVLSGSGPTIAALCPDNKVVCDRVGRAMVRASGKYSKKTMYKIVGVDGKGAEIKSRR